MPLRTGIVYSPYRSGEFGYKHILAGGSTRNKTNHPLDAAAKDIWRVALIAPITKMINTHYFCHQKKSNYNGANRTFKVFIDSENYITPTYGHKGIVTAYYSVPDSGC